MREMDIAKITGITPDWFFDWDIASSAQARIFSSIVFNSLSGLIFMNYCNIIVLKKIVKTPFFGIIPGRKFDLSVPRYPDNIQL